MHLEIYSALTENIYPVFDQLLDRSAREELLEQKACCFWLTGLSGSGKTTVAKGLEKRLHQMGYLCMVLDGDNIRTGISKNLTFSAEDRTENIRRIAEVNRLMNDGGIITINSFVSPTKAIRSMAKEIIGPDSFNEVFINASLEACEERDVKGLYKKARAGEIKNFTGIDAPFEAPDPADLEVRTDQQTIEESVEDLLHFVLTRIKKSVS